MLLLKKGDIKGAEKLLKAAEKKAPENTALKTAKSQLCIASGERDAAEMLLKDLIKKDPGNYPILVNYTEILNTQGRYEESLEVLKSLKGDMQNYPETISSFVDIYNVIGDREKAVEYASRLIGSQDDIDIDMLGKGVELFDKASDSFSLQNRDELSSRIGVFIREFVREDTGQPEAMEESSFLMDSVSALENEYVPIIDVGGIEPVIEINEEEVRIKLGEIEEEFDPDENDGYFREKEEQIREEITQQLERSAPPQFTPVPVYIPSPPQFMMPPSPPAAEEPPLPGEEEEIPEQEDEIREEGEEVPEPPEKEPSHQEELAGEELPDAEPEEFNDFRNDPEYFNPGISNLLEHLEKMTADLGKPLHDKFMNSMTRLRIDSLRLRLQGSRWLIGSVKTQDCEGDSGNSSEVDGKLTENEIAGTLSYIKKLAGFLPEKSTGKAVSSRLENILGKLKGVNNEEG